MPTKIVGGENSLLRQMRAEEEARAEKNGQSEGEGSEEEPGHTTGIVAGLQGLRRSKRKRPPEVDAGEQEVEPAKKRAAITPGIISQRQIQFSPLAEQLGQGVPTGMPPPPPLQHNAMPQATFVAQQAAAGGAPRKGTIIAALAPTLSEADGGEYMRLILQAHIDARTNGTLDEFWDMVLLEGSLITVAFMNPGEREVQIMHSIGKFTGGFTTAPELRGKVFGFRGDREVVAYYKANADDYIDVYKRDEVADSDSDD